jgi:hypothetical protein
MARRKQTNPPQPGLQALIQRVDELTGPELRTYMRDTLGVENHDAQGWMRVELHEHAQAIYLDRAKQQMRLAAGLSVIAMPDDEDPTDDDE